MSRVITLGAGIARKPNRVALVGCPNVGKTSLFNALTGMRQKVGNYPGITVERRTGGFATPAGLIELVDLPGTYSLLPRSPDERVARDELLGRIAGNERPDVVIAVVDAGHLERSLFLVSQLLEVGRPLVVALNQVDVALDAGLQIDVASLEKALGVPVIPTSGRTGAGKAELASAVAKGGRVGPFEELPFPEAVKVKAAELSGTFSPAYGGIEHARRGVAPLLGSFVAAQVRVERLEEEGTPDALARAEVLREARAALAEQGVDVDTATAQARYVWASEIAAQVTTRVKDASPWQYRLDRVLGHPFLGSIVLALVFTLLFQVVYSWSGPAIELVDGTIGGFGKWLGGQFGDGLLAGFVSDGVVAGLGAFLVFVPQIAMLFVLIEALEDSGYLARAAFLLDRIMGAAGLPGRAFLPMLSGFACAIPGIMATRSIENKTDRFITMLVLPLMSCSARLPVYAVIVGALFTPFGGWVPSIVVLSMYVLGILLAFIGAKLLRRTIASGPRSPLLLELPPYRCPSLRTVLGNTYHRTWSFVKGAGPIIFGLSIALWVALTFPRDVEFSRDFSAEIASLDAQIDAPDEEPEQLALLKDERSKLAAVESAERLAHTYMGRAGKFIEPAFEPLGFDWKIDVAILGSFAAREVFVPTLGVIYAVGETDEDDPGLLNNIRNDRRPDGSKVFTPLVGISLLVFYVIALQCMSTLAVIKRETNSWKWALGVFVVLTGVAYVASLIVFQLGSALGF